MTDLELQEPERLTIIGISNSGKITYNLVENEGSFKDTGLSVIRRLRDNRNQFIADMYISQNYLSISRFFDTEIIYSTDEMLKDNSNITDYDSIVNFLEDDDILIENMYIYDIETDVLIIRIDETDYEFLALDYKDLQSIQKFINTNNIKCRL